MRGHDRAQSHAPSGPKPAEPSLEHSPTERDRPGIGSIELSPGAFLLAGVDLGSVGPGDLVRHYLCGG